MPAAEARSGGMISAVVGTMALLTPPKVRNRIVPRLRKSTPEHNCYRYYDWIHGVNREFEARIKEDLPGTCDALMRAKTPSQVIEALGMPVPEDAREAIDFAMPDIFVETVTWDVRRKIADGILVRFDWQQADEWDIFWPPMPPEQKIEVCVIRGPSMF
jgi:hypothetical protein